MLNDDVMPLILTKVPELDLDRLPDPRAINYKTQLATGLYKDETIERVGEFREFNWYLDIAKTQKALTVQVAYRRDPVSGLPVSVGGQPARWTRRTWWSVSGLPVAVKWTPKLYPVDKAILEGERRRANNLRHLKYETLALATALHFGGDIAAAEIATVSFLGQYLDEEQLYLDAGALTAIQAVIAGGTADWLDATDPSETMLPTGVTIRDSMLARLIPIVTVPDEPWTAEVLAGPQGRDVV